MKIPEKLKIGGSTYNIQIVDRIGGDDSTMGCVIFDESQILIKDASSEQAMEKTLLHELVHVIHEHMGALDNPLLDEQYVNGFANALYAVICQNPGVFNEPSK